MGLLSIEHGKAAYWADFWVYGAAVLGLAGWLWVGAPSGRGATSVAWAGLGLVAWTLLEYLLHRFVLHGIAPFSRWHAEHHARPTALMGLPTLASASLFAGLIIGPLFFWTDRWITGAFSLGLLSGYLAYALVHHATHHWRATSRWGRQRKRLHALHHHTEPPRCFGVTTGLWDQSLGSGPVASGRRRVPASL